MLVQCHLHSILMNLLKLGIEGGNTEFGKHSVILPILTSSICFQLRFAHRLDATLSEISHFLLSPLGNLKL